MLKAERAKHRFMGLETEIIGPEEIAKIAPVTNVEGILGALYDPLDGHLDPSGTTHAYAKAARMGGAEIVLHTKVLETNPRPDGTWDVVTDKGTIHAEHVVNAAGSGRARWGDGGDLPAAAPDGAPVPRHRRHPRDLRARHASIPM
jgi:dimethylglycine dehydrogenase